MSEPQKRINEIGDMEAFQASPARQRLANVIVCLAQQVVGVDTPPNGSKLQNEVAAGIHSKLCAASHLIDQIKPVEAPQRFGNPAYRDWAQQMKPIFESSNAELNYYIVNAFGSSQRIDYGTGHELNFIAYWDGSLRLSEQVEVTPEETLVVFAAYFDLCRKLITTYKLEPAGSHGVWGLDDHFHLPFILGAAQLSSLTPEDFPKPKDVLNIQIVEREKGKNMYFAAIAFIYSVKRGAFFEHSPILYDVSGIKNWSKVMSGMIKMYNGEVLSRFPVVQHFYLGKLFPFN